MCCLLYTAQLLSNQGYLHPSCCLISAAELESCVIKLSESSLTVFKKDLHKDVAGDTSGNFAKLLLALVEVRGCVPACVSDSRFPPSKLI